MRPVGPVEPCAACDEPVQLNRRHVTVTRNVERQVGDEVTVYDSEVLSYLHLSCGDRMAEAGREREAVG